MTTYFVSRHAGAIAWAERQGISAQQIAHLDIDVVKPGDVVLGTLPIQLAAEVNAREARYLHLELSIPSELRGKDLTADDMDRMGARLQEYHVTKIGS